MDKCKSSTYMRLNNLVGVGFGTIVIPTRPQLLADYENDVPGLMRTMFEETPDFGDSKEHQQLEDTVARLCQGSDKDEVRCPALRRVFFNGDRGGRRE
jgi:hypothetical protein